MDRLSSVPVKGDFQNYFDIVEKDSIASRLLSEVPWVLDGSFQDKALLQRALITENAVIAECETFTFSLITPMWDTPPQFLKELIASCRLQTWADWELILVDDASTKTEHLAVAKEWAERDSRIHFYQNPTNLGIAGARNSAIRHSGGPVIGILDHDDLLHPQLLGVFGRYFNTNPAVNLLYCNEVKISTDSTKITDFYAKPEFDLPTLIRTNYICHFLAIRRSLLDPLLQSGEAFNRELDGVEDHDLLLRLSQSESFRPHHLPIFGYCWRESPGSTATSLDEKPYVRENAKKMLQGYLESAKPGTSFAVRTHGEGGNHTLYSIHAKPKDLKRLSVIVPYKDQPDLTVRCLEGLLRQDCALEVDIWLINNDSEEPHTAKKISDFVSDRERPNFRFHRIDYSGAFNFGKMHNWVVNAHANEADLLLFLNNDVELISNQCLSTLAGELEAQPSIAFTGIKLWYPGRQTIQHAGIKPVPPVSGIGFFRTTHIVGGHEEYAHDEHVVLAVTFACAMVRRKVFEALGGFDETFFPNGYGDVDMCLKAISQGYHNFYFGTLEGIHHEASTRTPHGEELEASLLSMNCSDKLMRYLIEQYGHNLHLGWNYEPGSNLFQMHLRYRVADQVNAVLKRFAKPAHSVLKALLKRS